MKSARQAETLHERLVAQLREEVRRVGRPGRRLPTDQALAARFGVSNVTVRNAMLVLVEQGWVVRRRGSGTYVADRQAAQHVGILTSADLLHSDTSPMRRQLARDLRNALEERGYATRLYLGREAPWDAHAQVDCPEFDEAAAAGRLQGLVVMGTYPEKRWYEPMRAAGIPMVFTNEYRDLVRYCVLPDHRQLGREAVETLVAHGRRRIALLQWMHPRPNGEPTPDLMWEGFCEGLAAAGITRHDHWVRKDLFPSWKGSGWSEFREIWAATPTKPDGLIVGDDMLFADVAEAIGQLGIRVPEQLLVVAQINSSAPPRLPFPMITMEIEPERLALGVAETLDALLRGQVAGPSVRLVPFRQRRLGFTEETTWGPLQFAQPETAKG